MKTKDFEGEHKIFEAGYMARFKGKPLFANPYIETDVRHRAWIRGWKEARGEDKRKPLPLPILDPDIRNAAMQAGYDAGWRGVTLDSNPYKPGDLRRRAWSRGWREAQAHIRYHHNNPPE